MLQRRIDDLVGLDPDTGETIQGQRYTPDRNFVPILTILIRTSRSGIGRWGVGVSEAGPPWPISTPSRKAVQPISQRSICRFPQRGALLVWNNMAVDGTPNPNSLHAGRPVVKGTKYVLTKWYRTRAWG
jgi:prolyl 4-hydroxylase